MATDAEQKGAAPKRSKLPMIIVMSLMLVEGVAIFAVSKFIIFAEPANVEGAETDPLAAGETTKEAQPTAEVEIAECTPSNSITGRLITFRMHVSALVARSRKEEAQAAIESNQARITDRVNYIVRSAEPHHLAEPGLETLKRRIKHELDTILGDEHMIVEVLIPEMLQSGPGV